MFAAFTRIVIVFVAVVLLATTSTEGWSQGTRADYQRAAELPRLSSNKVWRWKIEPHWFADNTRMWYRNDGRDGRRDYVVVDATGGERREAFDHSRLAESLAMASGETVDPQRLPFERLNFVDMPDGVNEARFNAFGKRWRCSLDSYEVQEESADEATDKPAADARSDDEQRESRGRRGGPRPDPNRSPNGRWLIRLHEHNLQLVDNDSGDVAPLSTDGSAEDSYGLPVFWSPDSQCVVAIRTRRGGDRRVHLVESSPKDQLQPKLHWYDYLKPGDEIPLRKPQLFHVESRQHLPVSDALFPNPWSVDECRWSPDSQRFTFLYNERGHQRLRIIAIDARTGEAGVLLDETSDTFVDYAFKQFTHYADASNEIIWMSERDGWNHLYLFDSRSGSLKNPITSGPWVVRKVERVDEELRQIWFQASGIFPEQDPYYIHYCRVDFSGENLVVMTRGNGTHKVQYSPDRQFVIDTYSRVDQPPIHELRRTSDGTLVCELEQADASELWATGQRMPQRFVAKGRDGETDIYGIIHRPTNFDPAKKYPVIEKIYAGPHGSFVPKDFNAYYDAQSIAELGFIVVQIDGMGTSNRSKAFHNVCWKNLGDSGFPDRILWIKAAAAEEPAMDLTRVGIYGGSAGGQSSTRALLAHGDFYHVAVSDCGCHDNRMDKIWWNELWMSWPIGPHYEEQSNVTQAHRLEGKLLLIVGELDRNVDPASTMQVANALIQADKDFDMLVIPGAGHGSAETPYGRRRRADYFVRHLLGVEPRAN